MLTWVLSFSTCVRMRLPICSLFPLFISYKYLSHAHILHVHLTLHTVVYRVTYIHMFHTPLRISMLRLHQHTSTLPTLVYISMLTYTYHTPLVVDLCIGLLPHALTCKYSHVTHSYVYIPITMRSVVSMFHASFTFHNTCIFSLIIIVLPLLIMKIKYSLYP